MRITVAICTWNRAGLLAQALEAMTTLVIPADVEWEVLVVNNNSTDATDDVIRGFAPRLPIRGVFEPRPGLSNARNLAVREATGDYVLWADDDVLVPREWISEYSRAFALRPDAAVFGGPIEPWFSETPPPWLQEVWPRVAAIYGGLNLGDAPVALTNEKVPFGGNIAVRSDYQNRFLYDPALGLRPGSTLGGEETTVVRAMLASGATGWWVPTAGVRHYVQADRFTTKYVRSRFFGYGQFLGMMDSNERSPKLFGRPRWLWREAIEGELRYRLGRAFRKPTVWIEALIAASIAWGQLRAVPVGSSAGLPSDIVELEASVADLVVG
jgi:glycosyltransferase involved in cell wall biosynthesis